MVRCDKGAYVLYYEVDEPMTTREFASHVLNGVPTSGVATFYGIFDDRWMDWRATTMTHRWYADRIMQDRLETLHGHRDQEVRDGKVYVLTLYEG